MTITSAKILFTKLRYIAYDKFTSAFDIILYALNFKVLNINKIGRSDEKIIVYICDGIMIRIPRIAKWIKNYGFTSVFIANKALYVEEYSGVVWDYKILFRNKYHLKRIIKQLKNVYLYHVTGPLSLYPDIIRQNVNAPFIYDMKDVYSCYYGLNPEIKWLKEELFYEKRCLKLANGVVGASLEPNVALRKYGKPKPPTIYFPLYCDNDFFKNNTKQLNEDNIHLVYAGGIAGSHRNNAHYGVIQFHHLIKVLSEQKIHFHIYPSPATHSTDRVEYEQIAANSEFFHIHQAVSQEKLSEELDKYHFGLIPFFSKDTAISKEKIKYATSLKLFNYIEAGLPVIVSKELIYQSWIVDRYNAGYAIDAEDLHRMKEIITSKNYTHLASTMIAKREEISLKTHIPRLVKFYEQIADK